MFFRRFSLWLPGAMPARARTLADLLADQRHGAGRLVVGLGGEQAHEADLAARPAVGVVALDADVIHVAAAVHAAAHVGLGDGQRRVGEQAVLDLAPAGSPARWPRRSTVRARDRAARPGRPWPGRAAPRRRSRRSSAAGIRRRARPGRRTARPPARRGRRPPRPRACADEGSAARPASGPSAPASRGKSSTAARTSFSVVGDAADQAPPRGRRRPESRITWIIDSRRGRPGRRRARRRGRAATSTIGWNIARTDRPCSAISPMIESTRNGASSCTISSRSSASPLRADRRDDRGWLARWPRRRSPKRQKSARLAASLRRRELGQFVGGGVGGQPGRRRPGRVSGAGVADLQKAVLIAFASAVRAGRYGRFIAVPRKVRGRIPDARTPPEESVRRRVAPPWGGGGTLSARCVRGLGGADAAAGP